MLKKTFALVLDDEPEEVVIADTGGPCEIQVENQNNSQSIHVSKSPRKPNKTLVGSEPDRNREFGYYHRITPVWMICAHQRRRE